MFQTNLSWQYTKKNNSNLNSSKNINHLFLEDYNTEAWGHYKKLWQENGKAHGWSNTTSTRARWVGVILTGQALIDLSV